MLKKILLAASLLALCAVAGRAIARDRDDREDRGDRKWVATWPPSPVNVFKGVGSTQTSALVNFAFPASTGTQAINQTLRMIVKPDIWSDTLRLRLSNTWGTGPVTFGRVTVGLHSFSGAIVAGTIREVTFGGQASVT